MYAFRVSDEAEFSAAFGDGRIAAPAWTPPASAPHVPSYMQQSAKPRGSALVASAAAVAALFSAMVWMNVAPKLEKRHHVTTVDVSLTPPPSEQPKDAPQDEVKDVPPVAQSAPAAVQPASVEQPAPIAAALPVVAAQPVAPPAPVAAPEPQPAPAPKAPSGPAEAGDLSARLLSFSPPSYPMESRRLQEEGTVVLALLLGTDGRVSEISVSGSSGFARLDKAALDAVRKWRWAPLVRGGEPVMVRGFLKIPFGLRR